LLAVATDGATRRDVDPIQLRWAGVPRSQSFHPIDLRRGQREFLNVLFLDRNGQWHITTFEDSDFDPGFPTELTANSHHVLEIAVFSDNAETILRVLVSDTTGDVGGPQLSLRRI
jgi:hypothetical protein